jgi:GDP-L-fucose synthase
MKTEAKIYVAGHRGLVGSAIVRRLHELGYDNLVLRTRGELDLREQADVREFIAQEKPEYVFMAAATVGGIVANNTYPATFVGDNIMIQTNVIDACYRNKVTKLLFLGSSCIYPRDCPQPMKEHYLLSGYLEPTNQPYAVAKIAGIEMVESYNRQYGTSYISVMPTNLYGPGDNFDIETSHVLPALIRKFHGAKLSQAGVVSQPVVLWGTGAPRRELLHVDDMADACIHLMNHFDGPGFVNIGTGEDLSVRELADLVRDVIGYDGKVIWDTSKPDGAPRKLLDVSKLSALGWHYKIPLRVGVETTYDWFRESVERRGLSVRGLPA